LVSFFLHGEIDEFREKQGDADCQRSSSLRNSLCSLVSLGFAACTLEKEAPMTEKLPLSILGKSLMKKKKRHGLK
jgi:hypothetical protein